MARNYKQEYETEKQRDAKAGFKGNTVRQQARRLMDDKGVNRTGRDVGHKKAVSQPHLI